MKIKQYKGSSRDGSVLVVTMSILAVAAISVASYLILVQSQTASVSRSQTWNSTIAISEAGVEEGLALVNNGAPAILVSPWDWTNTLSGNGWSAMTGSQTTLTRYVSGSNSYTVTVDISSGTPTITAVGNAPYNIYPWVFSSAGGPFLAAAGQSQSTSSTLGRKIAVQTVLNALFTAAVITKSNFNMNGKNCLVNSFDSSNPLYSTGGQYDAAKMLAGGSLATDSSIVGDINLGNGTIYGHVMTGPGTLQSAVQMGPHGTAGDLNFVNGGNSGIEAGYWSGDFNVNIPDVSAPPTGNPTLPAVVGGVLTLNGGNYTVLASDPKLANPLNITAPTTLWVQGSYSPPGLTIATTNGAKLYLYLGTVSGSGDTLGLGGNNVINQPGYSANLQFYGLPSLNSIDFHGNAGFNGVIYAPDADMTGGGGGNNTMDTSGAMIVRSCSLNGHWNFHYDQSLTNSGPSRGWIAKNWTELKYP